MQKWSNCIRAKHSFLIWLIFMTSPSSILPTATPYSRNSIFSGLFPLEIEREYPEIWEKGYDDDSSRNRNEKDFLSDFLKRENIHLKPEAKYIKILDSEGSKNVERNIDSLLQLPFVSIVVNFVDILSHKRSESDVLKEIAPGVSVEEIKNATEGNLTIPAHVPEMKI